MVNNTLVHVNIARRSSLPLTLSLPPSVPPCFYLSSYLLPSKSDHPSLLASSASARLFLFICLSSSGSQILPRCAFLSFPLLTLCCNFPPHFSFSSTQTPPPALFISPCNSICLTVCQPFQPFIHHHSVADVV